MGTDSFVAMGGADAYFAPGTVTTNGPDKIVNLVPSDGQFVGNWKNIFPYNFVQQAPMQLGPLGITSMTNPGGTNNPGHTTIVNIAPTNFLESGIGYNGFVFTLDRLDSAQTGDGSQWMFSAAAEPSAVGLFGMSVVVLGLFRRRRN